MICLRLTSLRASSRNRDCVVCIVLLLRVKCAMMISNGAVSHSLNWVLFGDCKIELLPLWNVQKLRCRDSWIGKYWRLCSLWKASNVVQTYIFHNIILHLPKRVSTTLASRPTKYAWLLGRTVSSFSMLAWLQFDVVFGETCIVHSIPS